MAASSFMILDKSPVPVNKHNNKGSSSLAGGRERERSSEESSDESASHMRPSASFNPRSAYHSQTR